MARILFRVVLIALGLVVVAAIALRQPAVQDRVMGRVIGTALARNQVPFRGDALSALLCGSSGPLPHATRAGPCVAVSAGGRTFVVDVGRATANRAALLGLDFASVGGVLLTHFHSDHIQDLGEWNLQTWVAGRAAPLRVFGPPGVEGVVAGFAQAYELDTGYRTAHHGADLLPPAVGALEAHIVAGPEATGASEVVLDEGGLRITAFAVDHNPVKPAYGYRFDYQGRSVVVSGDTALDPRVIEAARGADVLFHEAQANHIVERIGVAAAAADRPRLAKIMSDIPDYHTSPSEAAEIANAAGVKLVVFYHLTPPPPVRLVEQIYARDVDGVRNDGWLLGDDGLLVELPVGSDEVEVR
ncbi:MAG: MBL fold metallo-hydrolase [Deltaproteobacteria bacterium]|nr:MBL fold metallo-hydrolase [Deltaproteobacteria bacterium]MBW2448347.1 MBL fold metallo-hydrolase [Deltaproteobacteria bacterium]